MNLDGLKMAFLTTHFLCPIKHYASAMANIAAKVRKLKL